MPKVIWERAASGRAVQAVCSVALRRSIAYIDEYCGTETQLVAAMLECIECLIDDITLIGGRFSSFALLMMMSTVCLFNVCFDICFAV